MTQQTNASIKDVAELAGVSPTTVSRVINNSDHPVNDETKFKVEKAIKKLNYQPNRLAQGLKNNKSKIIGVIVHDISDSYFAEIVKGIENITFNNDYIANIINTERDIDKELKAVNLLKVNMAEGIVFTGGHLIDIRYEKEMEKHIKELKNQNSCILGVTSHPFEFKNIEIGNFKAGCKAVNYLLENGHKNIAFIKGPDILSTSRERFDGYEETMIKNNISIKEKFIFEGDFSFEGGRKAARKILKYKDQITGIVAANDKTALGLIWELKKNNIKVPDKISVIGIGDIPSSKYADPPLTTVSLPLYKLGEKIGKYIIGELKENKNKEKIKINNLNFEIGLKQRSSTLKLKS